MGLDITTNSQQQILIVFEVSLYFSSQSAPFVNRTTFLLKLESVFLHFVTPDSSSTPNLSQYVIKYIFCVLTVGLIPECYVLLLLPLLSAETVAGAVITTYSAR